MARSDVSVLLTGESGTGKELLAAHIHRESPFAAGPFVKVNCAAIPTELIESELFGHEKGAFSGAAALRRGKFELADGGTIFLDEIGDLHEASQAKLLRILQDGELQRVGGEQTIRVATRVVSATNRRLSDLISDGRFREDLYYRLSVVPIRVPALRERMQDIAELVPYFLSEFCARNNFRPRTIDPDAVAALERYAWPGNVRELRNVVERMAILTPGDRITAEAIPLEVRSSPGAARRGGTPGSAPLRRTRAHPAGARPDRLERLGGGAAARHRADGSPQADPRPRPEALAPLSVFQDLSTTTSANRTCKRSPHACGHRRGRPRNTLQLMRAPAATSTAPSSSPECWRLSSTCRARPTPARLLSTRCRPCRRLSPDRALPCPALWTCTSSRSGR